MCGSHSRYPQHLDDFLHNQRISSNRVKRKMNKFYQSHRVPICGPLGREDLPPGALLQQPLHDEIFKSHFRHSATHRCTGTGVVLMLDRCLLLSFLCLAVAAEVTRGETFQWSETKISTFRILPGQDLKVICCPSDGLV